LGDKKKELDKRGKKLGQPSQDDAKGLIKYFKELKEVGGKFQKEIARVGKVEGGKDALKALDLKMPGKPKKEE
jgi:hypothetical protein